MECGERDTDLGPALLVRVHRADRGVMSWRELWDVLDERYPGRWGLQSFPHREIMLDQANKYFVLLLPEGVVPRGFDPFGPPHHKT